MTNSSSSDAEARRESNVEFVFGSFRYEAAAGLLYRDGVDVCLPPRAAAVLEHLLRNAGTVLSKDDLIDAAWPDSFVSEDSLTHAISLIRGALDDDPKSPRYVQTLPRRGYRFVGEVSAVPRSETLDRRRGVPEAPPDRGVTRSPVAAPRVAVAVLLGLVFVAVWSLSLTDRRHPVSDVPEWLQMRRLAIAPFSTSGGVDTARFAAAAVDAIRERIETTSTLTVVEAAAGEDVADADAVMAGTVGVSADRLQITVLLRSSPEAERLWTAEWDLHTSLVDADDFARSLVSRLRFLLDLTTVDSRIRKSSSAEATRLVVLAADLLTGPGMRDLRVAQDAARHLTRATELDPGFARARAGRVATIAEAEAWRSLSEAELAVAETDAARAAADDPRDPVVQIAIALNAMLRGDMEGARVPLDEAQRLGNDMFWVYLVRAGAEIELGLLEQALATTRRGLELDPYLHAMHGRLVDVLLAMDDIDSARQAVDHLALLDPDGYWSGRALARLHRREGDFGAAAEVYEPLHRRFFEAPWIHVDLEALYAETDAPEQAARERGHLRNLRPE